MRKNTLTIVLVVVVILLSILLIGTALQNKKLRTTLPYLVPGEKIKYFDVTGANEELVKAEVLTKAPLSLIFIFNRKCSTCDGNILYWNRMAKLVKKDNVKIYGIILPGPTEMFNFKEKAKVSFDLFTPENREKFKNRFRIKINLAQTILCVGDKVGLIKLGQLGGDDYNLFLTTIKNFNNKKGGTS
ncbi:MAG: redoxin domain-containing protein [Candidatus Aminicenantes bacterium]|nr:redoxin domain-containing protein [Candidatus Aminicenantes bacterium]